MAATECTRDMAAAECTVTAGCVVTFDVEGAVTGAVVTGVGAAAAGITGDTAAEAAGEALEAVAACTVAVDRRAAVPAIKVAVVGAARDSGAADSAAGGWAVGERAVEDQAAGARAGGDETDEATVRGAAGDVIAVEWDLAGQALVAGNSEEEDLPAEILEAGDSVAADLARRASVDRAMTDSAPGDKTATTAIVPLSVDLAAYLALRGTDPEMKENAANAQRFVLAETAAGQVLIDPKPVALAARQKAMTPARGAGRIAAAPIGDRRAAAVTARHQTATDPIPVAANSADRATAIEATHKARRISSSR